MRAFAIKISGHVFDDLNLVSRYIAMLRELVSKTSDLRLLIVTGGGRLAREYASFVRKVSENESLADIAGILVSRVNAFILASGLVGYSNISIPEMIKEVLDLWSSGLRVVVCGGLQPGQSTTTVALILAEALGIKSVVNCANVDAVYTSDPRVDKSARRLSKVSIDELMSLMTRCSRFYAGTYELFDLISLNIAKRSKMTLYVVDGREPERLISVISQGTGYGTIIVP